MGTGEQGALSLCPWVAVYRGRELWAQALRVLSGSPPRGRVVWGHCREQVSGTKIWETHRKYPGEVEVGDFVRGACTSEVWSGDEKNGLLEKLKE